jgi:hypothetical protein
MVEAGRIMRVSVNTVPPFLSRLVNKFTRLPLELHFLDKPPRL